jgi:hypothetical protein
MITSLRAEKKASMNGLKPVASGRARQQMWKKTLIQEPGNINEGKWVWRQSTPIPTEEESYYRKKGWVLSPPDNIVLINGEWQEPSIEPAPLPVPVETAPAETRPRRKRTKRG